MLRRRCHLRCPAEAPGPGDATSSLSVQTAGDFSPSEVAAYYAARLPELQQRGREWRYKCSRHNGAGDNFTVNAETGAWYCHSECGCGGDIIELEMALTRCGFQNGEGRSLPTGGQDRTRAAAQCHPHQRRVARDRALSLRRPRRQPALRGCPLLETGREEDLLQVRPSGVEAAGTTDPERTGGVPTGGIVVGLAKGKYLPDPKAERATGKPTWKRASRSRRL